MKPAAQTTFAERVGRTLGRLWRACVRLDQQATHWLVAKGWGPGVAKGLMLLLKLAVFAALLYGAFWLAILISIMAFVAWTARNSAPDEPQEWAIGDQADHKQSIFYDPINYDDDPDPRFNEKR